MCFGVIDPPGAGTSTSAGRYPVDVGHAGSTAPQLPTPTVIGLGCARHESDDAGHHAKRTGGLHAVPRSLTCAGQDASAGPVAAATACQNPPHAGGGQATGPFSCTTA